MDVEAVEEPDEVAQALAAADAIGKSSKSIGFEDIADGLRELDMDNYDEEDDGIFTYLLRLIVLNFLRISEITFLVASTL